MNADPNENENENENENRLGGREADVDEDSQELVWNWSSRLIAI